MAKLTREEIKDYVRSIVGEFDSKRINEGTLNKDINLSQRKIQLDTLDIGGRKQYTKIAYGEGAICSSPDDLLFHPNSIIDIEAATGAKGSVTTALSGSHNDITFTAVEPGTDGNDINIIYSDTGAEPMEISAVNLSTKSITVAFDSGLPAEEISAQTVVDLINEHPAAKTLVTAALATNNEGTGAIAAGTVTTTGGTGTGWKYAEEKSIEEFNRVKNRNFAATTSEPLYRRLGDSDSAQVIEFTPNSIKYSKIYYHYLLADLTEDTDTTSLPAELEELLLIDLQKRVYIYLNKQQNTAEQNADYTAKLQAIDQKYQNSLLLATQDKQRIGQIDK